MIVHRDYTHHGNSSIKIFPDRIEFFNPGRLPDNISVSDLRQGTYVSDCRNKLIAKIFKEIDWIERYGTGIRRITDYFREYGSPEPQFENFQHGFKVTAYPLQKDTGFEDMSEKTVEKTVEISEKNDERLGEKLGETVEKNGERLGENQKNIVQLMQKNSHITIPELSEQIKISETAIQNNISKLKAKGIIERIGPDKGGYWKIIQ